MATFGSRRKGFLKKENLEYAELFLRLLAYLVGGYWTFYIFKYQYEILPEKEPTSLILKSSIKKVGTLDTLIFYQIELTLTNKSKSIIKVAASHYNIIGSNIHQFESPNKRFETGGFNRAPSYFNNFFLYDTSSNVIIQTDQILNDNSILSPESEFNIQHAFAVPKKRFESLSVTMSTISAKKNADIIIKWQSDSIGRNSAYAYIVKTHLLGKNDTIFFDYSIDKRLGEKYDICFTTVVNDYFINKIDPIK